MPQAYSDDLRSKLLKAYAGGRGSLTGLAEQFGVSYGYSKKIRRQQLATGESARPGQLRHGPRGKLTIEMQRYLRTAVKRPPDVTLAELQRQLLDVHKLQISRSRLWYWLRGLGLRHQKNTSRAGAGQRRKSLAGAEVVGTGRRGRSRPPGVSR